MNKSVFCQPSCPIGKFHGNLNMEIRAFLHTLLQDYITLPPEDPDKNRERDTN